MCVGVRRVSLRANPGFLVYGPDRLLGDLRDLGYGVDEMVAPDGTRFAVVREFVVPTGRFVGRVIDVAVQATPDFPRSVASAIHISAAPQLFECSDTQPNVRNITSSALGVEWRYWSHNFGWQGEKTARRLISQINGILDKA